MVRPRAGRHQGAVDDRLGVLEGGAGGLHVQFQGRVRRDAAAAEAVDRRGEQRPVADLGDRLVGVEEGLEDLAELGVVAQILGGPAAGDDDGHVIAGVHLGEGQIGRPGIAGFLGVGVEARLEVVDHELELLAGGGRDVDVVALLAEALVGVQDLQGLRGVAGDDEDLRCHVGCAPLLGRPAATCLGFEGLPRVRAASVADPPCPSPHRLRVTSVFRHGFGPDGVIPARFRVAVVVPALHLSLPSAVRPRQLRPPRTVCPCAERQSSPPGFVHIRLMTGAL